MNKKGLFINFKRTTCSIYESGLMIYNHLSKSENFQISYVEVSKKSRKIKNGYDFYVFNYHFLRTGWIDTERLNKLNGQKIVIVLEMSEKSPFHFVSMNDFDSYIVIDPTFNHFKKNVYPFPRPLDDFLTPNNIKSSSEIVIGSFGLSIKGKGFENLAIAIKKEFKRAKIRINIPLSSWINNHDILELESNLLEILKETKISLEISNFNFSKNELIKWCSNNDLNAFFYDRDVKIGLAATTDQAISSGKPLCVSPNPTFRHLHDYIKPYPVWSLKESLKYSPEKIELLKRDWSSKKFNKLFENVLNDEKEHKVSSKSFYSIPRKNIFYRVYYKSRHLKLKHFSPPILNILISRFKKRNNVDKLLPYISKQLDSYSQFGEDIIIDQILKNKSKGFYVDVGASDPFYNSNTQRFYERGWCGINIEPGISEYLKITIHRKRDVNLNFAISDQNGEYPFYEDENDSSISSLLESDNSLEIKSKHSRIVKTRTLDYVFKKHLKNRKIDLLSVDAEGFDLNVLKSNNWEIYRPKVVVVECNKNVIEIKKFMNKHDYIFVYSNHINAIFINYKLYK